mgnify:CR=1 FL=1
MVRVKRGTVARRSHKKVLKQAKGFRGSAGSGPPMKRSCGR